MCKLKITIIIHNIQITIQTLHIDNNQSVHIATEKVTNVKLSLHMEHKQPIPVLIVIKELAVITFIKNVQCVMGQE